MPKPDDAARALKGMDCVVAEFDTVPAAAVVMVGVLVLRPSLVMEGRPGRTSLV